MTTLQSVPVACPGLVGETGSFAGASGSPVGSSRLPSLALPRAVARFMQAMVGGALALAMPALAAAGSAWPMASPPAVAGAPASDDVSASADDARWAQWPRAPVSGAPVSPSALRPVQAPMPILPAVTPAASAALTSSAAPLPDAALLSMPLPAADAALVEMFAGETRVLSAPEVARIAVGDGNVLHAAAADGREVVVFARAPGVSSLVIWHDDGTSRVLRIEVVPGEARRIQAELAGLLARIPNVRSTVVGDKLIVEGDDLSDADQQRIADLAARYPQVVDFTGVIGWDRMVLFDVQVVELPRSSMRDLGVRWDPVSAGGFNAGAAWDGGSSAIQPRPGEQPIALASPISGVAGYLGLNALLSARLHAMSQSGEAVLLAQPQLLARSGATASFLAGGELPYTTIDANGNTSTVFKPYGVGLDVTPRIDRNGTVRAHIEVEVSAVDPVVTTASGPALRTRRTATEFNVRSGQTLVLSGFLSREHMVDEEGVPGLSRIPGLGALFRARRTQARDTELAIFVTPVLVSPDDEGLAARVERGRAVLDATFPQAPTLFDRQPRTSHVVGFTPPPVDPFRLETNHP